MDGGGRRVGSGDKKPRKRQVSIVNSTRFPSTQDIQTYIPPAREGIATRDARSFHLPCFDHQLLTVFSELRGDIFCIEDLVSIQCRKRPVDRIEFFLCIGDSIH